MDRAARLGRHRRGESLENSRRARGSRRGEAGAAVIIDSDEDCGGGGAAPAVVLAGAVSMQTRSWRMAMQAPVAPVVVGEPPGRKRRTGASAEAGSKGAGTSRSASREKRRVRSRSASGSSLSGMAVLICTRGIIDSMNEEIAPYDDDYDYEMLEEKLVGDVIRAYRYGADLDDPNGVEWEAEDEMEFHDADDNDDDDSKDDSSDKAVPMHGFAKLEAQDVVDHHVDVMCHEDEEAIKDEMESKGDGALSFNEGSLHIEILDSDEEVKVVNDTRNSLRRKPLVQAKLPIVPSCVAWRTRSSWGLKEDRISYNTYFEELSDEPKEDNEDTEVELDDGDDDDDDNSASCDEEEEEKKEEYALRRKQKKEINSSDDEINDDTVSGGLEWEEEYPEDDITRPLIFQKNCSKGLVGNDIFTKQQKMARFTWELERRKKLKLGIMENCRLHERDLDTDSNSSSSRQDRKNRFQGCGDCKTVMKKKNPLSKTGKKSSRSIMLKRQLLLKLLMDKISSNEDGKSSPFDQKPQIEYSFKDLHPLVFKFGDDDHILADMPEQDAALDMLWADLDFALESENIGTYYDDEGHESSLLDLAHAPVTPCSRGKHEFIIDEQIGIRCKYCSLVNLEIKFILPSLASNFAEKPTWRNGSCLKNALLCHDLYEQTGTGDEQPQDFHLYGTVWDLIPGVITTMYQHQREAFEFMWTNLVGDIRLNELKHGAKPDVVGGCVICHAPGTGKTRLAIVFIQTYMKAFPDCRPVIIAPRGMLFAWEEEFKKWNVNVPFHIMNTADYSGKEDRDICMLVKKEHRTEKLTRLVKLLSWNKGHGVLGISYGLYMKLTSEKSVCTEENKVRSILLENPGLLVLDEGHTPRNERSVIWKTLGKVKTEKRIILSGLRESVIILKPLPLQKSIIRKVENIGSDSDARVLLASTRACCEGISLTGASRVVLLDVVWNPAVGRQAVSRAFRIGQKKFVYTYNLITYGTGEGDKYDRQAEKDHLSKLVFSTEDEFNNVRNMLSKAEMEHCSQLISEDKVLEEMTSHDQLKGMFLKIHYPPTESNIVFTYNQIAPDLS
ncbi:hypothetical protein GUJ93_ZPchr0005g14487 [Zizania palustris]|uniref:Helicase C-terminal domain-containing protein n=1 Tax=Zizania palustris TaxID=103762 RepID=A0A8J5SQ36_ZIZPA|nr:hypothetical protein GUJ93_ZPchr0005g14487 [Zizania palustris]